MNDQIKAPKEALMDLLDRPTIVPLSREGSRAGTPQEAFVLGVSPEAPIANDGARGSQDEDQERSHGAGVWFRVSAATWEKGRD